MIDPAVVANPVSTDMIVTVIQMLGLPGIVFLIWYYDRQRFTKLSEMHGAELAQKGAELAQKDQHIADILLQYREDVSEIKKLYQNNAHLCGQWEKAQQSLEKLYLQTIDIIALNTQAQTRLVDKINASLELLTEKKPK
jgi:ABC-type multidrug transport system fused ATPase/permease subunit